MHMARQAVAWVAWAEWTCNLLARGLGPCAGSCRRGAGASPLFFLPFSFGGAGGVACRAWSRGMHPHRRWQRDTLPAALYERCAWARAGTRRAAKAQRRLGRAPTRMAGHSSSAATAGTTQRSAGLLQLRCEARRLRDPKTRAESLGDDRRLHHCDDLVRHTKSAIVRWIAAVLPSNIDTRHSVGESMDLLPYDFDLRVDIRRGRRVR